MSSAIQVLARTTRVNFKSQLTTEEHFNVSIFNCELHYTLSFHASKIMKHL